MQFVKMQGCGNDYVYIDAVTDPALERRFGGASGRLLVRRMSDRHRGIGSDGVILVCRAKGRRADVRMRMFNADGSESEMCGNGVRCVAKLAHDRLGVKSAPMRVETGRGVLSIEYRPVRGQVTEATVDMGRPILGLARIPVVRGALSGSAGSAGGAGAEYGLEAAGRRWVGAFVSMGNPHFVVFSSGGRDWSVREVRGLELARYGPAIERHRAFPRRMNVHFVARRSKGEAVMRTWERGAGETQACGTGACAAAVAGVLTGRFGRRVRLHLPGGDLRIEWESPRGRVFMTGPAEEVFEGDWR